MVDRVGGEGEVILERGEPVETDDPGVFVLAGGAATLRPRGQAAEVLLPGAVFGLTGAIGGGSQIASVEAREPVVCVVVPRSYTVAQLRRTPAVAEGLLRELARELQSASRRPAPLGPFAPAPTVWDPERGDFG